MSGKKFFSSFLKRPSTSSQLASSSKSTDEPKTRSWGRRLVSGSLLALTGGVALSALDDLVIYGSCSSKAMEKATENKTIKDAIGEPIVRGPWYNASLAVAHRRNSVSCTFPVSGPQGTGILQLKAVRNADDDAWFSYFRKRDWEILIMEALVHVPTDDKKQQTFRISLTDNYPAQAACKPGTDCKSPAPLVVVASGEEVKSHTS